MRHINVTRDVDIVFISPVYHFHESISLSAKADILLKFALRRKFENAVPADQNTNWCVFLTWEHQRVRCVRKVSKDKIQLSA